MMATLNRTKSNLEQHAWFRVIETIAVGFQKDKITENAAAMTYYGVFSLFPVILLFMSILGLVLQNNGAAQAQVMDVITRILPAGQGRLQDLIQGVIEAKGVAAGIGLLTLLWSALGFFQVIDTNVNEIWGVSKPRSFIKGKLFALAMVAGIGGVALASFVATGIVGFLGRYTGGIPGSVFLWQFVVSAVSFLAVAAVFYFLYRYAPQRHIEFGEIWPAALITALLWEVTRRLVAIYIQQNGMVSGYGPIGAAMALLLWIYIASIIILLGAELSYAIAKERRDIPLDKQMKVISPPGEQPTPKFAPQVGTGFTQAKDEREPTVAEDEPLDGADGASPDGRAQPISLQRERRSRQSGRATGKAAPAASHVTPIAARRRTDNPPPAWLGRAATSGARGRASRAEHNRSGFPMAALLGAGFGLVAGRFGWFRRSAKRS